MFMDMSVTAYCIIVVTYDFCSQFFRLLFQDYLYQMHFLSSISLESSFCCRTKSPKKFWASRAWKEIVNINCAHYTSVTFYDKKRSCKHSLCCNRVNVIYFVFDCKKASIYLKVIYSSKESEAIYVVCIYYTLSHSYICFKQICNCCCIIESGIK